MSDNFHSPSLLGAANAPQFCLPAVRDTSPTGSIYSVCTAQAPVLTAAGPLPPTSAHSFQTLTGSAYLCQYSSTAMWAGEAGYCHSSASTASYARFWGWDMVGNHTVTLTDQGPVISSSVMTCHYATYAHADALVSPCPPMFPSLAQGTPAHTAHQGHSMSLSYWEGNQGYYYPPHPLGPLCPGERGPCLQPHGSVSSMGTQTQMTMALKDGHSTHVLSPVSTTGMCYSVPAEPTTVMNTQDLDNIVDTTAQGKNMKSINVTPVRENATDCPTEQGEKNKQEDADVSDLIPQVNVQLQNPEHLLEEAMAMGIQPARERAPGNKPSYTKSPTMASTCARKTKSYGQKKARNVTENNPKNGGAQKQPGNKVKLREKTSTPKERRKRNQPEPGQEASKKPRSSLAMHMMESVQVFHALGKKHERKPVLPSSRALRNAKDPTFCPAKQSRLDSNRDCQSPKKVRAMNTKRSADSQGGSPRQCELPPPVKVRLVPLPFLSPEQPRLRPVCRRPQALASRRSSAADPARPPPDTTQPAQVNTSRPANASSCLMAPTKPPRPVSTKATLSGRSNQPQSTEPQVANARPAPHTSSSFTAQPRRPVPAAATKLHCPPKPPHHYLLQDFSCQPIPWRKADIPGPVVSDPISQEQRPEREAMKRQAQQEREKAAQATFVEKLPFFHRRQVDMDISLYYGYAM